MKIIHLPVRVFEFGDHVLTPSGRAIVLHDELEGIDIEGKTDEEIIENTQFRDTVICKLQETCGEHPGLGEDVEMERDLLHQPVKCKYSELTKEEKIGLLRQSYENDGADHNIAVDSVKACPYPDKVLREVFNYQDGTEVVFDI